MRRTYVGSTIYHIYLSLLHLIRDSGYNSGNYGENILFLVESTPLIERLVPALRKVFFRDVYLISERKEHVADLGKFNYSFRRKGTLVPYLEDKHPALSREKDFIGKSDIYLCDTDSSKSYFLYEFAGHNIQMIEDGARTYSQRHTFTEQLIKSYVTRTPLGGGFDKEIKTIYAQYPERLPLPIRKKAKELNIKKEVAKLDESTRNQLFNIFLPEGSPGIIGGRKALVLTQPLSEDGVVENEAVKIAIYRDLISKIPGHLHVVIKTHPRELTRYEDHFTGVTVLPALFPIEILALREGFAFDQGYTLFSTALSNLDIVGERLFLGKDYLDKFTARATRELIKNMNPQA